MKQLDHSADVKAVEAADDSTLGNSENASVVKGVDDESNSSNKKKRRKKGQAKDSRHCRPSKQKQKIMLNARKSNHNARAKHKADNEMF